jgi:hypothetical protein
LPLLVPIVLPHLFPNLMDLMARKPTPVGLVITRIENGKGVDVDPQWVLNIGGATARIEAGQQQDQQQSPPKTKIPDTPVAGEVVIYGGLVIPLWVIILSLIGGAINMTTKVPLYQEDMEREAEGRDSLLGAARWLVSQPFELAKHMVPGGAGSATSPVVEGAEQPTPGLPVRKDAAGANQAKEVETKEHEHWRRGLLGLYMSLVSAPFLAIVTYYLLQWVDLAKVPILVIVSFSIGLLSARIVRSLTDLAGGFIDQAQR